MQERILLTSCPTHFLKSKTLIMSPAVLNNESSICKQDVVSGAVSSRMRDKETQPSKADRLTATLTHIQARIAPLWPLQDFVAVNPFVGLTNHCFLSVSGQLERVCDGTMFPAAEHFFDKLRANEIWPDDLEKALKQCSQQYPQWYAGRSVKRLLSIVLLAGGKSNHKESSQRYFTVSHCADRRLGECWTDRIVDEISKVCSVHFDEGQAMWPSPWKGMSLFQAWKQIASRDRRMEKWGIKKFRQWVSSLPSSPTEAILRLLEVVNIPAEHVEDWLWCQALSVTGWASHVRYRTMQDGSTGEVDNDLISLIAIRLAYDVAIFQEVCDRDEWRMWPVDHWSNDNGTYDANVPNDRLLVGHWLQVSAEMAYRRQLISALAHQQCLHVDSAEAVAVPPKRIQMVFCIDVRSEVIRRHIEAVSDNIETFGFAGFFGVPMAYRPTASKDPVSQLPVLLSPAFEVNEGMRFSSSATRCERRESWIDRRRDRRTFGKLIKAVQSSASSCFSFVEAYGLAYFSHLTLASIGIADTRKPGRYDGVRGKDRPRLGPVLDSVAVGPGIEVLDFDRKVAVAGSILRNLGLTSGLGRLVVLCGHSCQTVNNPYRAGLDCGACGGHSGEPNARVAADLLNDQEVRKSLAVAGIDIPADSRFIAAVHNTTTDEIEFFDVADLPQSHLSDLNELKWIVDQAGKMTRIERGERMGKISGAQVASRARFWSEVRPEWGLAGNAAFIVAPRSRTLALDIGGRAFMHSYDHKRDVDGKVLELIMTAPMIVASWINLQYYASSVDNSFFGSGNKVLHNVVGQFGILEGNAGDLRAGLPWQSVHDGEQLQHEPLRLSVIIEAPREAIMEVVENHRNVRDLVDGTWISLTAIDNSRVYRYAAGGTWEETMAL